MISASENRAAQAPASVLTATQQKALLALNDYRHVKRVTNGWQIGPTKFSTSVIEKLENKKLIIERRANFGDTLNFTAAGTVAVGKLKERKQ